jgi:hypothetical protein
MFKKILILTALLTVTACADKKNSSARNRPEKNGAEFTHNPAECPAQDGIYSRRDGMVKGLIAFKIQDGMRMFLLTDTTGVEGASLELDGQPHQQSNERGQVMHYVAGCENGVLTVIADIDGESYQMQVAGRTDEVTVTTSDNQTSYERAARPLNH